MALPCPKPLVMQGDLLKNWQIFRQQFENYMLATEADKKPMGVQVAIFLSTIGEDGLELYNKLSLNDDADDLEIIKSKLQEHFTPRVNVVWNRLMLYRRMRRLNETFAAFLESITELSKTCAYGDQEEMMLRDKIVAAINCRILQQKMAQNPDLTYEMAVKMCLAAESVLAQDDASRLNQPKNQNPNYANANLTGQMKKMNFSHSNDQLNTRSPKVAPKKPNPPKQPKQPQVAEVASTSNQSKKNKKPKQHPNQGDPQVIQVQINPISYQTNPKKQ